MSSENMKIKIHFLYTGIFIVSIFLLSCTTEPEGCELGFTEIEGACYDDIDLAVLQAFIDNSSTTIPMTWDVDSSGSIEPLELQTQKWNESGKLTLLWLYDYTINDDYAMSGEIPENIGDLTQLDTLNLSYNQFTGTIPQSIGNLINLDYLYLYKNKLNGIIPDSICNINPNDIKFQIWGNKFCPPYPNCININDPRVAVKDTSECL